jgi:predicted secreted protein
MTTATISLPLIGGPHVELRVTCPTASDADWLRRHALRLDREQPHAAVRVAFRVGADIRHGPWFRLDNQHLAFTDVCKASFRFI